MNEIINFIEQNRQTGSTTQLIKNIESGGYLVVLNKDQYNYWVEKYPHLKSQIFILNQIKNGKCKGLPRAKLFFDNVTIYEIISNQNKLIKILEKGLKDLGYMGIGSKLGEEFDKWREI